MQKEHIKVINKILTKWWVKKTHTHTYKLTVEEAERKRRVYVYSQLSILIYYHSYQKFANTLINSQMA